MVSSSKRMATKTRHKNKIRPPLAVALSYFGWLMIVIQAFENGPAIIA